MPGKFIICSDLDGTLLDEETYSYSPAENTLKKTIEIGIPILLVTSKTFEETLWFRKQMGIEDSFIVENGGGIYLTPPLYTHLSETEKKGWTPRSGFFLKETGLPVHKIGDFLERFCTSHSLVCKTFLSMTIMELREYSNLPDEHLQAAKSRQYDLPFILENSTNELVRKLESESAEKGLILHRGGRFLHLSSVYNKGEALSVLLEIYRRVYPGLVSVGLGDAPNDISLLRSTDHSVLIRKKNGTPDMETAQTVPGLFIPASAGPSGWSEAVESIVFQIKGGEHV